MSTTERTRATAFGLTKESERDESGAFPIGARDGHDEMLESEAVIAELSPELVSLIPEPPPQSRRPTRGPTPSERAELVIEDLSLWPENPYLANSLVPPPKRPFAMRRALAIAGGMLAAAGIGAAIQLTAIRGSHEAPQRQQTSAGITAPVPVAVASPRELFAPPAPVMAQAPIAAPTAAPPSLVPPAPVALAPKAEPAKPLEEPKAAVLGSLTATEVSPAPKARELRAEPPAPPEPKIAAPEATAISTTQNETAVASLEAAPVVDLPDYPTREQVTAGFESVRAALAQCAAGQAGTAQIKATIGNNGRISYALVGGDFDGSPAGSCMAKAVRQAQFPAFAQPRLKVTYPFAL